MIWVSCQARVEWLFITNAAAWAFRRCLLEVFSGKSSEHYNYAGWNEHPWINDASDLHSLHTKMTEEEHVLEVLKIASVDRQFIPLLLLPIVFRNGLRLFHAGERKDLSSRLHTVFPTWGQVSVCSLCCLSFVIQDKVTWMSLLIQEYIGWLSSLVDRCSVCRGSCQDRSLAPLAQW